MPGIAGFITRSRQECAKRDLSLMAQTLRHEQFYVGGMWAEESMGVYVCWTGPEGSFAESMPVMNERANVVLIFSGREFSSARTNPTPDGSRSKRAPTYVVDAYERAPSFPACLNGIFHGLLVDRTKRLAMLFNDRYGLHRLYYWQDKDRLCFSTEAKAILAVNPNLREIDPQGLGEFLSCGSVLENRTLFSKVRVLPPASAWIFRQGSLERANTYFDPRQWEDQDPLEPSAYYLEVRDSFCRTLPNYFHDDQPIAMSLTGGLDTRMIMAHQKQSPGTLPCYTFGGPLRDCEDVIIARRVAAACRQHHSVISVGNDFFAKFPEYAARTVYLTDGCVDLSRSPDLYLNEQARRIAPIRLTGNYGGEVLRSVRAFKPVDLAGMLFRSDLLPFLRQARQTYSRLLHTHPLSFTLFKQIPWHHQGIFALEQTQVEMRSPFLDNDFVRTVYRAPRVASMSHEISLRLVSEGDPKLARIRTDRGISANQEGLSGMLVRNTLEFLFKAEYGYDLGMPQWVAAFDAKFRAFHVERLFLGRHKIFHFRTWYRDALASYVREVLLDPTSLSRPYLHRQNVEHVVTHHLNGDRNYTTEIHRLLTVELINRLFVEAQMHPVESLYNSPAFAGNE